MTGEASGTYAVGIDIGTGSAKASVISPNGERVAAASAPYLTDSPAPLRSEQNPDEWWRAIGDVLGQLIERVPDIGGPGTTVGLTGQMHTTVLRDREGHLLRPAILWSDQRSVDEVTALEREIPDFAEITGNRPKPALTVAHLAWVRRNEPELWKSIATVAVPKDEIRRRFGAGWATEPSDASAMGLMDGRTDAWSERILRHLGLAPSALPPVVASEVVTGVITELPPGRTELRQFIGSPLIGGAGDQAAQAIALGVMEPGDIALSLGTSGAALGVASAPVFGAFRHALPSSWLRLNSTHAAGLAMTWLARLTHAELADLVRDASHSVEPPYFLPYLQGHRDAQGAPAAFVGLDVTHRASDLARAAMEGVVFELADLASSIGYMPGTSTVHLGGGGWRSPLWRQLMADAVGVPVSYADRDSAFGAALLAARSAGWDETFRHNDADPPLITEPTAEGERKLQIRRARFEVISGALAAVS